jgi:hypothetical protein
MSLLPLLVFVVLATREHLGRQTKFPPTASDAVPEPTASTPDLS